MRTRDLIDLALLAALWGASFLFMRVAAPEFGPVALMAVRVAVAAVFLLVVLAARAGLRELRTHAAPLAVVGIVNSALPFCLFAFATLSLTAGFASILNATSPLWGAIVAYVWLRDRLDAGRLIGLATGFGGILILVGGEDALGSGGGGLAIAAGLLAALSYGIAATYAKRRLVGVDPLVVATGSQVAATLVLALPAVLLWPDRTPSAAAWAHAVVMGIASTGLAYILYFRLIGNVGPARAIAVTYLVPVFAVLWGFVFLDEALTPAMLGGGLVVLIGTGLATGAVGRRGRASRQPTIDA